MGKRLSIEQVKYIINNYGVQFKSYYQDKDRYRESIVKNGQEVVYLFDEYTSSTKDSGGRRYIVGYNQYGALCYAVAPISAPDTLGENFLMTKIYPEFSHYIRKATEEETLKSFNQIRAGKKGIIHPNNILEYMLLLEEAKGKEKVTSVKRSALECFVESNIDQNWHRNRLIVDNIMLKVDAETFYKHYAGSSVSLNEIKKDFKSFYPKELHNCTITNLQTDEVWR